MLSSPSPPPSAAGRRSLRCRDFWRRWRRRLQHYGLRAIFALVLIEDFGDPGAGRGPVIIAATPSTLWLRPAERGRRWGGRVRRAPCSATTSGTGSAIAARRQTGGPVGQVRVPHPRSGWIRRRPSSTARAPRSSSPSRASSRGYGRPTGSSRASPRCTGSRFLAYNGARRRPLGRNLGEPRLLRRPAHQHDLRRHHQVLAVRGDRRGGGDRRLDRALARHAQAGPRRSGSVVNGSPELAGSAGSAGVG